MEISEKALNFIQEHAKDDPNDLRLKYGGKSRKMDFPIDFALLQIEARRKAQRKIPSFLENVLFVFPDRLSVEQASNEAVARFHASLMAPNSSLLDLTAGLGIDDLTFAKKGIHVDACEIDTTKAEALMHNTEALGLTEYISVHNVDSMVFAETAIRHYDTIFADPARRSTIGKRLHALSECQPDILTGMAALLRLTDRILIKSSPLLDLTLIRNSIDNLSHIYVVCLKGECKEVLIEIIRNSVFSGTSVVDLDSDGKVSEFECPPSPISSAKVAELSDPTDYKYLYEPNAGVMKTGAWGELSHHFGDMWKADINTHLFLSNSMFPDFPGRILKIEELLDKKALKGIKGGKFNVVARNHPLPAPEVAKRHSLIPGGDRYVYAFRYKGKPIFLTAREVFGNNPDDISNGMQCQE